MKEYIKNNKKDIIIYALIIIVVIIIRTFIATPVSVVGNSMYPTLHNGEILILDKTNNKYNRNDIVVVEINNEELIKRIIGMPGETISYKDGILYINGNEYHDQFSTITANYTFETIPENTYVVLGDNRPNSRDSRSFGYIKEEQIIGTTKYRIFPLNKIGKITSY